jgi:S-adenosylmethionine decarboxylase
LYFFDIIVKFYHKIKRKTSKTNKKQKNIREEGYELDDEDKNMERPDHIRLGVAYSVKFSGCSQLRTITGAILAGILKTAAEKIGATFLSSVSHDFKPQGATAAIVLSESHYAAHTWPETGDMTATFYTCGDINSFLATKTVGEMIGAGKVSGSYICHDTGRVEKFSYDF